LYSSTNSSNEKLFYEKEKEIINLTNHNKNNNNNNNKNNYNIINNFISDNKNEKLKIFSRLNSMNESNKRYRIISYENVNNNNNNNNNISLTKLKTKLKQKYNILFRSTLTSLIDLIEILISNKPFNTNGDSVIKANNNENISFSIDIFDPYNCEDDKRSFFIEQIINLLLTKIKYIQNNLGFNLDKEISKIKSWIFFLNKENNNSSIFNTSHTRMINNKNSFKDLSNIFCNIINFILF